MSRRVSSIGFVKVNAEIEPAALAGAIAADAHERLGDVVMLTCDWLEERGNPLNQKQKVALAANASRLFDGFESEVFDLLLEVLDDEQVV